MQINDDIYCINAIYQKYFVINIIFYLHFTIALSDNDNWFKSGSLVITLESKSVFKT